MGRTRVRRRRIALSLLMSGVVWLLLGPLGHGFAADAQARHEAHRTYVVHAGDTLWAIAGRAGPAGADPRAVVDAIERANGISPVSLVPGQVLVIPEQV